MQFLHAQIVLTHVIQRTHVILISLVIHTCHNTPDMGDAKSVAVFIPSPTLVLVSWNSSAAAKILVTHFWNILHMNSRKDSHVRHINVLPKVPCNNNINDIVNMIIILLSTSESNLSCCLKVSVRSAAILLSLLKHFILENLSATRKCCRHCSRCHFVCFWNLCPVQTPYGQNFPN